jgi:hypothetical protein
MQRELMLEWAGQMVQRWTSYHYNKERMFWIAATLLVGGFATIVFSEPEFESRLHQSGSLLLVILTSVSGLWFIDWQGRNKNFAANLIRASENLSARAIAGNPQALASPQDIYFIQPPSLCPCDIGKPRGQNAAEGMIKVPKVFYDEWLPLYGSREKLRDNLVVTAILILWALAAILRLWFVKVT